MASLPYILGFTGNRPSAAPGRSVAELEAMREPLERVFEILARRLGLEWGDLVLLSSAAEGADILACELAVERNIPLRLILPKPVAAFREDFASSPQEAWQRAEAVIRHAQGGGGGSQLRELPPPHAAPACYQRVNAEILAGSQALVVLWNGAATGKAGGAGDMRRLAQERGMPRIELNTLEPKRVDWVGL